MRTRQWMAMGPAGIDDVRMIDGDALAPRTGEVTIAIRAAGVNPADLKHARAAASFPVPLGYEIAGTVAAIGPDTEIASGGGDVGNPVLAFRVHGGYADAITVPARDVFARPNELPEDEAAGLLLAGTTAAEMLHVTDARRGQTVVLFGASGVVGAMVLQLAQLQGVRVLAVVRAGSEERVTRFGGIPILDGRDLADRLVAAAPTPIAAVLDGLGTAEATVVALAVAPDARRIVTIVNRSAAAEYGFRSIAGTMPASAAYRDAIRGELIALAGRRELIVPISRTYPLAEAPAAMEFVAGGRAHGKVLLLP